ncbi:MAG: hypothetical protein ACK4Y9_06080 [Hyphomonas sp.]
MSRKSAYLALMFGLVLAIFEIARNWGNWQPWPFWAVNFIAAGALVWGGVRTLNQGSSRLLSAAWGVTVGVFWMTYFSNVQILMNGIEVPDGEGPLTLVIGVMLLVAIAGLFMSLTRRTI